MTHINALTFMQHKYEQRYLHLFVMGVHLDQGVSH